MYKVGVLTLSDKGARGERQDKSGPKIKEMVSQHFQGQVVRYQVIPDDEYQIKKQLITWTDIDKLNLILTTGGTGLSPSDVTPQATLSVIDFQVPGITEAMRWVSYKKTVKAVLSRAVAGVRDKTLIINLPGSPKAVEECLGAVIDALPHGLDSLKGLVEDCGTD